MQDAPEELNELLALYVSPSQFYRHRTITINQDKYSARYLRTQGIISVHSRGTQRIYLTPEGEDLLKFTTMGRLYVFSGPQFVTIEYINDLQDLGKHIWVPIRYSWVRYGGLFQLHKNMVNAGRT